jgi:hypothetical protein
MSQKLDVYYVINYNQTVAKCLNKWDYMFMSQIFGMTQFEHISFKRKMLKPTYIFIQQHNFIEFENNIFLSIIHINHTNGLREFQMKLNAPF